MGKEQALAGIGAMHMCYGKNYPPSARKMKGKRKVRITRLNWDIEYINDICSGNGFTISEPATFLNFDDTKVKSLYGSRSPLYGTSYEDETAFIERYRCQCGEFKGIIWKGEECPICHTKVEFRDTNIKFTGWISLGEHQIVNPFYYFRLGSVIGQTAIQEILMPRRVVDIDGNVRIQTAEEMDEPPKHPFLGLGVSEFYKRYEEILDYFKQKKKKKADEIDLLLKEKASVFTHHIPVYSTFLRPQSITSDTFYFNSIDKHINPIFSLSERLDESEEIDQLFILSRIQSHVNQLWEVNFELLNKKEGLIRGQILGGSCNYTSRNVIIPDPSLRDDEIDLSYHTFLELYKFKIIYYLMKMDDIPLSKANAIWLRAYKFDNRIYEIMQFIVQKEKPKLLINRNPTLSKFGVVKPL